MLKINTVMLAKIAPIAADMIHTIMRRVAILNNLLISSEVAGILIEAVETVKANFWV